MGTLHARCASPFALLGRRERSSAGDCRRHCHCAQSEYSCTPPSLMTRFPCWHSAHCGARSAPCQGTGWSSTTGGGLVADWQTIATTTTRERWHALPSHCQAGTTMPPLWITCCGQGIVGVAGLKCKHCGVFRALTTGRKGNVGVGRAAELSGAQRPRSGRAEERHWGCGLSGGALLGQEGKGVRLKKGSDNQHVLRGGGHGNARGWGEAWHPPQWTLLCIRKEEVAATMT